MSCANLSLSSERRRTKLRHLIILIILVALLLTGCQQAASPTAPDRVETLSPVPQTTRAITQPEPSAAVIATENSAPVETTTAQQLAGCTMISPRPTPGPTQLSIFPPPGAQDWVYGAEAAQVTLIEYSDFQ